MKLNLSTMISRLKYMGSPEFMHSVAKGVAYEAKVNLIPDEFHTESDPYGYPWEKQKKPLNRILYKTGNLFNSFSFYVDNTGVRITNKLPYAARQNFGYAARSTITSKTRRVIGGRKLAYLTTDKRTTHGGTPSRKMLPDNHIGIGRIWTNGINLAFNKAIKEALKR